MKPIRTISRRSFLSVVCGASGLSLAACMGRPIDERPYHPPGEPRHVPDGDYGRAPPCSDGDDGRHADPPGHGRHCRSGRPPRH